MAMPNQLLCQAALIRRVCFIRRVAVLMLLLLSLVVVAAAAAAAGVVVDVVAVAVCSCFLLLCIVCSSYAVRRSMECSDA